jgi:hypothetical protein
MRRTLFLLAFALACLGTGAAVFGIVERAKTPLPIVTLDAWVSVAAGLRQMERAKGDGLRRALFLGDSTADYYRPENRLPRLLQVELNRHEPSWRVYSACYAGMHPFDAYYLADPLIQAEPDVLVIGFNLFSLADRRRHWFARPELAAWIPPSRLAEAATLPLHWQGLTLDQLVLRSFALRIGGIDRLRHLHKRLTWIGSTWETAEKRLDSKQRRQARHRSEREHFMATGVRKPVGGTDLLVRYGAALDGVSSDHPVLQVLGAAVSWYREAGIDVLVYVVPMNLEHLERVGVMNREGLDRSLARARHAVEGNGGSFVDLHALLPFEGFRDFAGHMSEKEPIHGPQRVAEQLADRLADARVAPH